MKKEERKEIRLIALPVIVYYVSVRAIKEWVGVWIHEAVKEPQRLEMWELLAYLYPQRPHFDHVLYPWVCFQYWVHHRFCDFSICAQTVAIFATRPQLSNKMVIDPIFLVIWPLCISDWGMCRGICRGICWSICRSSFDRYCDIDLASALD